MAMRVVANMLHPPWQCTFRIVTACTDPALTCGHHERGIASAGAVLKQPVRRIHLPLRGQQ
eukprot:77274-Chlamydomonas_euryale.AAC.3